MKNKTILTRPKNFLRVTLMVVFGSTIGCKGGAFTLPQFGGLNNSARVPAPATGSFQVPNSYSGGTGSAPSTGLGSSSFSAPANGVKTSQTAPPVPNFVSSIHNAQNQFRDATNQAFDRVNRATETAQSRVEQASVRVDRFGNAVDRFGNEVVQASAELSNSLTAPIVTAPSNDLEPPAIGTSFPSDNPTWRAPSTADRNQ